MTRTYSWQECPYCKRQITANRYKFHVDRCPENPNASKCGKKYDTIPKK